MTTKDTTNQPLPLYKRLDETRTQENWHFDSNYIYRGIDNIATFHSKGVIDEINAHFTALAVNNLAVCGDAMDETINRLHYCIDLWEMPEEAIAMIKGEIDNLAKALARIS